MAKRNLKFTCNEPKEENEEDGPLSNYNLDEQNIKDIKLLGLLNKEEKRSRLDMLIQIFEETDNIEKLEASIRVFKIIVFELIENKNFSNLEPILDSFINKLFQGNFCLEFIH